MNSRGRVFAVEASIGGMRYSELEGDYRGGLVFVGRVVYGCFQFTANFVAISFLLDNLSVARALAKSEAEIDPVFS